MRQDEEHACKHIPSGDDDLPPVNALSLGHTCLLSQGARQVVVTVSCVLLLAEIMDQFRVRRAGATARHVDLKTGSAFICWDRVNRWLGIDQNMGQLWLTPHQVWEIIRFMKRMEDRSPIPGSAA